MKYTSDLAMHLCKRVLKTAHNHLPATYGQLAEIIQAALDERMDAPIYYCNKCGAFPEQSEHEGCFYLATEFRHTPNHKP
jgi:hypothetical protein